MGGLDGPAVWMVRELWVEWDLLLSKRCFIGANRILCNGNSWIFDEIYQLSCSCSAISNSYVTLPEGKGSIIKGTLLYGLRLRLTNWKDPPLSTGPFSIAMLNYQRVNILLLGNQIFIYGICGC